MQSQNKKAWSTWYFSFTKLRPFLSLEVFLSFLCVLDPLSGFPEVLPNCHFNEENQEGPVPAAQASLSPSRCSSISTLSSPASHPPDTSTFLASGFPSHCRNTCGRWRSQTCGLKHLSVAKKRTANIAVAQRKNLQRSMIPLPCSCLASSWHLACGKRSHPVPGPVELKS